jgi:hypothetical protein
MLKCYMSFYGSHVRKSTRSEKGRVFADHLFSCFLKEKAIANATVFADVGSAYEKGHDL